MSEDVDRVLHVTVSWSTDFGVLALARPFRSELSELEQTIAWVGGADFGSLDRAVSDGARAPMVASGSGGSFSAAQHLARLHRLYAGHAAVALTPYSLCSGSLVKDAHHWFFSAGGSNVDAVAAVNSCIQAEVATTNVVTTRARSKVADLCSRNSAFASLHVVAPPSKKDGFLATNSLLAFCSSLTGSYLRSVGKTARWLEVLEQIASCLRPTGPREEWRSEIAHVAEVEHLVVLHDADTSLGAIDIESKLIEAGIKDVQLADLRHFAHGRHHWLAKNGASTGVIVFSSATKDTLAARTMAALPTDTPKASLDIPGVGEAAQLVSLLAAFYATEDLGYARGIDPGQPGVPDFGRKLYGLRLPTRPVESRDRVAIDRKISGMGLIVPDRAEWASAYAEVEARLRAASFSGVVLDYDGTVVDTKNRYEPPSQPIVAELTRLLRGGLKVGIATGRGRSAGDDLRAVLPKETWTSVTVGYYNGSTVHTLEVVDAPDRSCPSAPSIERTYGALVDRVDVTGAPLRVERRPEQLTLSPVGDFVEVDLWAWAMELIQELGEADLRVLRSSHSVDIVTRRASKLSVVDALDAPVGCQILRIGDRGRWPGNDHELLASNYGLSVDEVSADPMTCWNLAPAGVRGARATTNYLKSLSIDGAMARFKLGCG